VRIDGGFVLKDIETGTGNFFGIGQIA